MKKSVSMYGRVTPAKKPEAKSTSTVKKSGTSQGNGVGSITPTAAAKDRRSPVVTDQTIATNSVIQAANDPKIRELVIKQQLMDRKQRESIDKKRPRADGTTGAFHSLDHSGSFTSTGHHPSHSGQFYYKHNSFDESGPINGDHNHTHFGAAAGSFAETVFPSDVAHPNNGGVAQLDDVNSEITADAGL